MLKISFVTFHSLLLLSISSSLFAKVPIVVSDEMMDFVTHREALSSLLKPIVQKNEENVLVAYEKEEAKLAIVREDMLQNFYKDNRFKKENAYHVIGKVSGRAVLYFAANPEKSFLDVAALKHNIYL